MLGINSMLTNLWSLVWEPFHDLWGSVERTSTVGLQQRALVEIIWEAKISQLQKRKNAN